jgi:2-methylaconitate cis-trans-isomerase PrpF
VGIEEAGVDWGSNCGNGSAVVGLYAIEKGWVVPTGDVTRIVTRNTNTNQIIVQRVPTPAGALPGIPEGEMPGVPFPGYGWGSASRTPPAKPPGPLLPTGAATDTITAGGTSWTVSMVDAGAPVVMVRAEELGLDRPVTTAGGQGWSCSWTRWSRSGGRRPCGWGWPPPPPKLPGPSPSSPSWQPRRGRTGSDVNVMMLSMGKPHPALAITGSIALTLAARTPGTVMHALTGGTVGATLRLRTPAGVIETWSEEHNGSLLVGVDRTARTIATTIIHLPEVAGSPAAAALAGATQ